MRKPANPSPSKTSSKRRKSAPPQELALVGALIRKTRKDHGISQDKLAYAIPLDRAHIGMIENGKRAATIPTLIKIALALNCEVGQFFPPIRELRALAPD